MNSPAPDTRLPETWAQGSGRLLIDLDAVASNYRILRDKMAGKACGACVKADGYGLGMDKIAPVLAREGCVDFFVSFLEGGIRLRAMLPDARHKIHILTGLAGGKPADFIEHGLVPVLNCRKTIDDWLEYGANTNTSAPANIHMDTGMLRLGLTPSEITAITTEPDVLKRLNLDMIISHLACADEADNPKNREQRDWFAKVYASFGASRASLANSSGIFLGPDYHFDMARPGAALYGINPTPNAPSPVRQVVRLQGKILQVRSVDSPQTVGYGATYRFSEPGRIATLGVGYADGFLRSLSDNATAFIGDTPVPIIGRVSMDMIAIDISHIEDHLCTPGKAVDLIGPHNDVDALAHEAGTIGYEILTSLGGRYQRTYLGGNGSKR